MPRLLFISLEFTAGTFSGNGIYAASQVRALALSGCQLLVLAGKPAGLSAKNTTLAYQLIEVSIGHILNVQDLDQWTHEAAAAAAAALIATSASAKGI